MSMSEPTEWERKYENYECGCAFRRNCQAHSFAEVKGENATLQAELSRLQSENEKLREQRTYWNDVASKLGAEYGLARDELAAIKCTVVSTIGGVDYEGNPTSELNYLQRLRILVEKESELSSREAKIEELQREVRELLPFKGAAILANERIAKLEAAIRDAGCEYCGATALGFKEKALSTDEAKTGQEG